MTKYLYFDGSCGISGDMTVAALLDLGADRQKLENTLNSLHLDGFTYSVSRKSTYSISGCDFDVHLHHNEQSHEESYNAHEHHHHEHRRLPDVYEIIDRGEMSENARALAKKIFLIVAEAEAKAHGCSVEEVHFHEVGAIDSIVDIISAAVLLDDLQISNFIVTGLTEGQGFVLCRHGKLPVPVPAVLNIAEKYGIILRPSDNNGEMVTPTGIAIAAAVRTDEKLPAACKVLKSGIGLGKRDFGHASFLRVLLLEDTEKEEQTWIMESNIDDSTAEELGFAMEKLFAAGAYDVHFEPCYMKKSRPAYILRIITSEDKIPVLEEILFRHTSTIGCRKYAVERTCMERENITVKLPYGNVAVKKCVYKDIIRYNPEYESVKELAAKTGLHYRKIFDEARKEAKKQNDD